MQHFFLSLDFVVKYEPDMFLTSFVRFVLSADIILLKTKAGFPDLVFHIRSPATV